MIEPLVSVIVATRDRPAYLRDLLDSLAVSTYGRPEVVIIDDGSQAREENTRVITEASKNLSILPVTNARTRGTVAALNQGAAVARGDILAFTDDDCIVESGWVSRLVSGYRSDHVGGVGGRVIPIENDKVRPIAIRKDLRIGCVDQNGTVTSNFDLTSEGLLSVDHLAGSDMSFRRDVFERLGGFDEHYQGNAYRFETDWGVQVRRAGFTILFDPQAKVSHRRAPIGGNRVDTEEWFHWYARNHTYFLVKNFGVSPAPVLRFALRLIAQTARRKEILRHVGAYDRKRALLRVGSGLAKGFSQGWPSFFRARAVVRA